MNRVVVVSSSAQTGMVAHSEGIARIFFDGIEDSR